ncbi:MAG: ArsC family reductase [Burkholderiales bacterium]|jgi:arsenate reductase
MTTIYGIRNCDTMKRAIAWLRDHDVEYSFHDYKNSGVGAELLEHWTAQTDWEKLLNTRGTTWRKLSAEQQADMNEKKALELMQQQPSLIKRPVLDHDGQILVGFDEQAYSVLFGK